MGNRLIYSFNSYRISASFADSLSDSRRRHIRFAVFAVNITASFLWIAISIAPLREKDSPYAYMSAVVSTPIAVCYAMFESIAFVWQVRRIERVLGRVSLALAALFAFAIVANVFESVTSQSPSPNPWWVISLVFGVFCGISAYWTFIAVFRLRRSH